MNIFPVSLFPFRNISYLKLPKLKTSKSFINFTNLWALSYVVGGESRNQPHRMCYEPQQQKGPWVHRCECPNRPRRGTWPSSTMPTTYQREIAFGSFRMIRENYVYLIPHEKETPLVPFYLFSSQIKSEFH